MNPGDMALAPPFQMTHQAPECCAHVSRGSLIQAEVEDAPEEPWLRYGLQGGEIRMGGFHLRRYGPDRPSSDELVPSLRKGQVDSSAKWARH